MLLHTIRCVFQFSVILDGILQCSGLWVIEFVCRLGFAGQLYEHGRLLRYCATHLFPLHDGQFHVEVAYLCELLRQVDVVLALSCHFCLVGNLSVYEWQAKCTISMNYNPRSSEQLLYV